jgi:hypothetical protein
MGRWNTISTSPLAYEKPPSRNEGLVPDAIYSFLSMNFRDPE